MVPEGLEKSSSAELSEAAGMFLTSGLSRSGSAALLPFSLNVPFDPEDAPWAASDPGLADRHETMVAWLTTCLRCMLAAFVVSADEFPSRFRTSSTEGLVFST